MATKVRTPLNQPVLGWLAGVALPLAMIACDPEVFRATALGFGPPILGPVKPFGYAGIALGVCSFAFHLLTRHAHAVTAGGLAAGCVFAALLGAALLPFSVLGALAFGVGLLGLTPYVSSLLLGWSAWMEYRDAAVPHRRLAASFAFVVFFGICAGLQWTVTSAIRSAIQDISSGQRDRVNAGTARLERWRVLVELDALVLAWTSEGDEARKRNLADAYQHLTGEDIDKRASVMAD